MIIYMIYRLTCSKFQKNTYNFTLYQIQRCFPKYIIEVSWLKTFHDIVVMSYNIGENILENCHFCPEWWLLVPMNFNVLNDVFYYLRCSDVLKGVSSSLWSPEVLKGVVFVMKFWCHLWFCIYCYSCSSDVIKGVFSPQVSEMQFPNDSFHNRTLLSWIVYIIVCIIACIIVNEYSYTWER